VKIQDLDHDAPRPNVSLSVGTSELKQSIAFRVSLSAFATTMGLVEHENLKRRAPRTILEKHFNLIGSSIIRKTFFGAEEPNAGGE